MCWGSIAAAEAQYLGTYVWNETHPRFGGFSGLELAGDGNSFLAISDSGFFFRGKVTRVGDQIAGVTAEPPVRMTGERGLTLDAHQTDSEGLAMALDGRIIVSFEGDHMIRSYTDTTSWPDTVPRAPVPPHQPKNASLEALAIDRDGALYAIPERSGRANRPFPVYRSRGAFWDQPYSIPRRGAFVVTGADIGPDDRLYVLERDFTGLGFRTRVRRFSLDGAEEEVIMQSGNATHDNLEGISVWRDTGGDLRITMIADDNFHWYQQSELVEYRLTD